MNVKQVILMRTDLRNVEGQKVRSVMAQAAHAEVAKCELVCSNCHRLRTHRRGWHKATRQAPA